MSQFPRPLLQLVFGCLTSGQVRACREVCRAWSTTLAAWTILVLRHETFRDTLRIRNAASANELEFLDSDRGTGSAKWLLAHHNLQIYKGYSVKSCDLLEVLAQLSHLHTLNLSYPKVSLANLRHLQGLSALHHLELMGSWIKDHEVRGLTCIPALRELSLDCCKQLTNACLPALSTLSLSLDWLSLAWTNLSSVQGLQPKNLRLLACHNMTADGVGHVVGSRVEELDLKYCALQGSVLRRLVCCGLRKLMLDASQVESLDLRNVSLRELHVLCRSDHPGLDALQAVLESQLGGRCLLVITVKELVPKCEEVD